MGVKVVDEKEEAKEEEKRAGRKLTRRDKMKLGGAGLVVVGLGVGLGVGLSRGGPAPGPTCVYHSPWTRVGETITSSVSTSKHTMEEAVVELYASFGSDTTISNDGNRVAGVDRYGDNVTVREYDTASNEWVMLGTPILSGEPDLVFENKDEVSFGAASVISGDGQRVAVTSPFHNSPNITRSGRVRVYEFATDDGDWKQIGNDILGTYKKAFLGRAYTVDLSKDGSILVVGDYRKGRWAGCVTVYKLEEASNVWTPLGDVICGSAKNDRVGASVSLSADGDAMAVGFQGNERNVGAAAVYRYEAKDEGGTGTWTSFGGTILPGPGYCHFGWPVSLTADATRLAVGGSSYLGNGLSDVGEIDCLKESKVNAGEVRVYELLDVRDGTWTQMGPRINGAIETDALGWSVSISGDGSTLAVGASNSDRGGLDAGYAEAYRYECGEWSRAGSPIEGADAHDWTGFAVSLSYGGTRFAVGSPNDFGLPEGHPGAVNVYNHEF
uniref:Uncharacterized protein n=1 Tax=Odontella aurita TaxID=265563 RepID=A0A7S4MX70_9STRA|mmetsp:Transcript_38113/g.113892  ORF Transcript_38113/g.113892 Transcript_38113/m.113892 type:complete len:497 (+) Transcript_38113:666-2156(+)